MKHILAVFAFLALALPVLGQGYQLGQKVQNFTLKDATTGKNLSLSDFANQKTLVLVFTNGLCPYSKLYENRLLSMSKNFGPKGVQFVLVNPSVGLAENGETLAQMQAKSRAFGSALPYLADEGQQVTTQFGATKTPEVFVLHNTNGEFYLKYKGAIDDNPQVENYVNEAYLKNAIEAVLSGQNLKTVDKRATGCLIKK